MKTICIAGKNNIAVDVLLYCLKNYSDYRILCVCNRNDTGKNSWQKSLKWFAEKNNVELVSLSSVYKIENLLFLSLEFDQIIKPYEFKSNELYNIHFSMLPKYKGMYTSVMPILNNEKYTGVTLHKIRAGIDTGEIIEQDKVVIERDDTSLDLYTKLIKHGTLLVIKNLNTLLSGNIKYTLQSKENSTYYSINTIDYLTLKLDVNKTGYQIKNQIRAFCFRPYQLLSWNGIKYIDCKITDIISEKKPGIVLEENEFSTQISTIDYNVILYKDVFEDLLELIRLGDNDKVDQLLFNKKIIYSQDLHGWSLLTVAVYNNNLTMVKKLIEKGADINILNCNGTNLLMYAKSCYINTNDSRIFELLLNMGLSPYKTDYYDKSLIDYCINEGISNIGNWVVPY